MHRGKTIRGMTSSRLVTRCAARQSLGRRDTPQRAAGAVHTLTRGRIMEDTNEKVKTPPKASLMIALFAVVFALFFVLEAH